MKRTIASLILLFASNKAFAQEEFVGKRFYCSVDKSYRISEESDMRRQVNCQSEALGKAPVILTQEIIAYDPNRQGEPSYQIQHPAGFAYWAPAGTVVKAINAGVLVSYEQVEKDRQDRGQIEKEQQTAKTRAEAAAAAKQNADRIQQIKAKRWPAHIEQAVLKGHIMIGMSEEQVRMAWGRPDKINRTVTINRTSEQWMYGSSNYLYFDNGVLTSYQTAR
jgi:hypothetical protein